MLNQIINRYPSINKYFQKKIKNKSTELKKSIKIENNLKLKWGNSKNYKNIKEKIDWKRNRKNLIKNIFKIQDKPKHIKNNSITLNKLNDSKHSVDLENNSNISNQNFLRNLSYNTTNKYKNYIIIKHSNNENINKKKKTNNYINTFKLNKSKEVNKIMRTEYLKLLQIYKKNSKIYKNININ